MQIDLGAKKQLKIESYDEDKPIFQKYEEQYKKEAAPIAKQQEWKEMPIEQKETMKELLPDTDKDGVPDSYDCQPNNPDKQDSLTISAVPQYLTPEMIRQTEHSEDKARRVMDNPPVAARYTQPNMPIGSKIFDEESYRQRTRVR